MTDSELVVVRTFGDRIRRPSMASRALEAAGIDVDGPQRRRRRHAAGPVGRRRRRRCVVRAEDVEAAREILDVESPAE